LPSSRRTSSAWTVLQPILMRPNGEPGRYELVAGERRWRAAKAAGLTDIPANVRELTDAEVLEIQIVENLQRKDLHELEEAEGFEKLLKCSHADGSKYGIEDLMKKVGRSRTYVFGRLKLLHLCPEARKAFLAGEVDGSKALLVARIGHHDTQRQALKDIQGARAYGRHDPMSYREAHDHILRTYMLVLKEAPFDIKDPDLVPKAGACGPCLKRSGNAPDLFGDVKSADVCTDPKCFDDKRQAHYSVKVRELEAEGNKVIAGEAAKKLLPNWDSQNQYSRDHLQGGYTRLEDTTYASGRSRKVSEILGPDFKPTLVQHPGTGEIVKVATQQAVSAAANKASKSRAANGVRKASGPREPVRSADEIFRERLFIEIYNKIPKELGKAELLDLAKDALEGGGDESLAAAIAPSKDGKRVQFPASQKIVEAEIAKQNAAGLQRLIYAGFLSREVENTYCKPTLLLTVAKRYRVDPAKVKKAIAEECKEKKAAAPAKKKAKK
jgi:ParB/RepB/Spo0J family partition protein